MKIRERTKPLVLNTLVRTPNSPATFCLLMADFDSNSNLIDFV